MVIRLFNWLLKKVGFKTLFGFSLLTMAVSSAALGLGDVIRGLDSSLLFRLVLLAILLSWFLARTKSPAWASAVIMVASGIVFLVVTLGQLVRPLLALFRSTDYLIWEYLKRVEDVPIDPTNFNLAYAEVYYGISGVIRSFWDWVVSIFQGIPLYDEIAITLVWGILIWIMASWAGWILRRHNRPLLSMLPIGILLTGTLSYTWSGTVSLVPMLFATLLLMTLANYSVSEKFWKISRMDYPEDLPKEFGLTSVVIVLGVVGIATFLPTISIKSFVEYVQQFTKPQIEEVEPVFQSFGLEQSHVPREDIGLAIRGGFPRGHLMGSGPELAEEIVMVVNISAGIPKNTEKYVNLPLYWRSLTYDDYFGFGWRSSDIMIRSYDKGESALSSNSPYHKVIQQDFRMAKGESHFLFAAGDIMSADDDFKIAYRPTPKYTEIHNAHGDFFGASIDKASYRVQSLIPTVSERDLRSVEEEFPEWITERYLILPDSIPSRVFRLAEEITIADSTIYDKAKSLEQYLRSFEYTLEVEMPPLNRDMVDYFLFDLKKGYCDYYATSMVVMARSLGIPSRIAIGYYRGSYDDVNRRYIVTEADAHSWVEVYVPDIGWVPFEPTAGRSEIERLPQDFDIPEEFDTVRPLWSSSQWFDRWNWNWTSLVLSFVLVVMVITFGISIIDNYRINSFSPSKAITNLYHRLYRFGRGLNSPALKGMTPNEFSERLMVLLGKLFEESVFESTLYPAISEIQDLTKIYVLMLYSPVSVTVVDRNQTISIWRRLRRRLWIARLRQLFTKEETSIKKSTILEKNR
jgi:hypothetical protein